MRFLESSRNSNVEMIRIVGMLFVILHHMISQGFSFVNTVEPSMNLVFLQVFNSIGNLGNKLFIIISGYYLCGSKFSVRKVISVWLELFIYSLGISLILYVFKIQIYGVTGNGFYFTRLLQKRDFRITELFFSVFPFLTGQNWFITAYIVFLFFVPFLNAMVNNLEKRELLLLNLLCIFLFNIVQLIPFSDVYVINNYSSFIQMFFAGAYLKRYSKDFSSDCRKKLLAVGIILPVLYYSLRFIVFSRQIYYNDVNKYLYQIFFSAFLYDMIFVFSAFMIFAGILGLQERENRFINLISSTVLGIYLLHDHNYFRRNIWFDFCHLQEHFNSSNFIAYMLFCCALVFLVFFCIDLCRKILLEPGCIWISKKVEEILVNRRLKKFGC